MKWQILYEVCKEAEVSYLWRWNNGEGVHNSVGVLFPDFGNEQCAHTGSGSSAERVCQLEALKAIASLGFLAYHLEDVVYQLGTLCVVTLGPVVS